MSGVSKALWLIFVIILPFLGVFIYVIAHGSDMKAPAQAAQSSRGDEQLHPQTADDEPADELSKLAALKNDGVITEAEFAAQKARSSAEKPASRSGPSRRV
jgi:hypothetical protein